MFLLLLRKGGGGGAICLKLNKLVGGGAKTLWGGGGVGGVGAAGWGRVGRGVGGGGGWGSPESPNPQPNQSPTLTPQTPKPETLFSPTPEYPSTQRRSQHRPVRDFEPHPDKLCFSVLGARSFQRALYNTLGYPLYAPTQSAGIFPQHLRLVVPRKPGGSVRCRTVAPLRREEQRHQKKGMVASVVLGDKGEEHLVLRVHLLRHESISSEKSQA